MSLLLEPHHDGSPLYLPDDRPTPDGTVTVRMRTHVDDPVTAAWVRTTYDAEPVFHECRREATDPDDTTGTVWWSAELPVHNPVTHYRFLLADGPAAGDDGAVTAPAQRWLTAAGIVEHDGPDAFDFTVSWHEPAPDWGRDGVVYQVFPDRFARSAQADERPTPAWALPAAWDDEVVFELDDPRTAVQLYGGDLDGVVEHLDHVAEVGATILYTTPVFPGESNHRYNASTFDGVDPLLGGDEAYARLSAAVHERGWRILGDLTTNHTGDTHEWFLDAVADPESDRRTWYHFAPDGSYECWMGWQSLPKLNHADDGVRRAMVAGPDSVVARWLRPPFDVDGWRIDVANMTGRLGAIDVNHAVAHDVRRTVAEGLPDGLVIGEHNHDASGDLDGAGWHGTMNYSGFAWPVWSWLRDPASPARAFGRPVPVPRRSGPSAQQALREWLARFGWRATSQSWNVLGSHDSARIRTVTGDPALHRVAAGLQFTLPGVPMVFAGDEIGLEGIAGEDSRRPMPWHRPETWDRATLTTYSALAAARAEHVALRRGSLRWAHVDDDCLMYLREHPAGSVLVCVRRAPGPAVDLPADLVSLGEPLVSTEADPVGPHASDHPGLTVWRV
ncbi:glycoside hydrolase family 13 protein [Nocardioides lijunqiniae]|uniref:glycoside hydrolase family 13 protein n=1 Tax=Nocardioides lijunqiniae TaxID=2760832 RepID=UPI0018788913|nr:glycoside hydrolase family 13 protein [Nocardioides lijunqiniae]